MPTDPAPMPTVTAELVAQLDQAIDEAVHAGPVGLGADGAPAEGMTPRTRPLPELTRIVDLLAEFAGPAIAAPLVDPARVAVDTVEHLTGRLERLERTYRRLVDHLGTVTERAHRAESHLPAARAELVRLGRAYAAGIVDSVHAEELARELEELYIDGRLADPVQASARVREARKRATKAAHARLADLTPVDAD